MARQILIVEDDELLARGLEIKLKHEGLAATRVRNGKEALKLITQKSFNIVLLDLFMPTMDGFAVLETLKQKGGTMPTIFVLTNLDRPEQEQRVHELGAKKFFIKSDTSLDKIVQAIKEV